MRGKDKRGGFWRDLGVGVDGASTKRPVTIIQGIPGVGKSTLTVKVAHEVDVLQHFKGGILWTALGQKPDITEELRTWGQYLGSEIIPRAIPRKTLLSKLSSLLRRRQALLIVDDFWILGIKCIASCAGRY